MDILMAYLNALHHNVKAICFIQLSLWKKCITVLKLTFTVTEQKLFSHKHNITNAKLYLTWPNLS